MTMKCIYAIPTDQVDEAHALCNEYESALESLAPNSIALSDNLRIFVESLGAPILKLDDEDWLVVRKELETHRARGLVGDIFWPNKAVRRAQNALKTTTDTMSPSVALASWLTSQAKKNRAAVLLTC